MKKDINNDVFTEETKLKLDIFRECFREWFPVFLNIKHISRIFIYDFFAGSGQDIEGTPGSPLILIEEAKGDKRQYCKQYLEGSKSIMFAFNEFDTTKKELLNKTVIEHLSKCKENCSLDKCVFENACFYKDDDFQELIKNQKINEILENKKYGKFILLDQYGFQQISEEVFLKLVNSPKTDFIFFIASSFIKRFSKLPAVLNYFKEENITFDDKKPKECHRVIADYFRGLIPSEKEYYLHHFTIKKGSNYYGLIFGTNHTFGMEKFLKVCWKHDVYAGESNCNMFDDYDPGTLFYTTENTNKQEEIRTLLKHEILSGIISNNKAGLKFVISKGGMPNLYLDVIDDLLKKNRIHIDGKMNKQVTNIHNVDEYKIILQSK